MNILKLLSPRHKAALKSALFFINRTINRRKKVVCDYNIKEYYASGTDTFFGYYDITPFNDKEELVYLRIRNKHSRIDIIKTDLKDNTSRVIADSSAWNWQQGCRLRWLSDDVISFNDFTRNKYINRILNVRTDVENICNWPLYDIDKNNILGLTLNFERLGRLRPGYGYSCVGNDETKESIDNSAISIVDINNDSIIRSISYREIATAFSSHAGFDNCYINHLSFSPKGDKFLFFWIEIINGYHKASLGVYNLTDGKIIPLENNSKVSHYVWMDDDTILCTVYASASECKYYRYCVKDVSIESFCPQCLTVDGHPSIYNQQHILTDTYPDSAGYQYLRLVDSYNDSFVNIAEIYSVPVSEGEKRTDLHPRFNSNKTKIAFDANFRGRRSMCILDYM